MRRLLSLASGAALVAAAILGASACGGDDDGDSADQTETVAEIYSAVIRDIVANDPAVPKPEPTVYIEGVAAEKIPLEVQVKVVARLKDVARVRFIDERGEAVLLSEPGQPVRDNGVLIAVAPAVSATRWEVGAFRYLKVDDVPSYRYTLEFRDGGWDIIQGPFVTTTTTGAAPPGG